MQRLPNSHSARANHQPRINQSIANPRKPKFRPPDLSLLDVPSIGFSRVGHAPPFIRVAQRTSRSRKDGGKSRPNRKYLRMMTERETEDVNEYLLTWREGALKPKIPAGGLETTASTGRRSPLQPCTGNQRIVPGGSLGPNKPSVREAPLTVESQHRSRSTNWPKPRSIQTTLNDIVRLKTTNRKAPNCTVSKPRQDNSDKDRPHKRLTRTGHLLSSLGESGQSRPATLETLGRRSDHDHTLATFHRQTDDNNSLVAPNPLLAKFLQDTDLSYSTNHDPEEKRTDNTHTTQVKEKVQRSKQRPRKRRPRQVIMQAPHPHDAVELLTDDEDQWPQVSRSRTSAVSSATLLGLGPTGTTYTTTFDISPIPVGTCFSERTFIGSGAFKTSFVTKDLDQPQEYSVFLQRGRSFRWGPWDDIVSTQLGEMTDDACESLEQLPQSNPETSVSLLETVIDLLKRLVQYLCTSLSFYDTIDRIAFLQRCKTLMSRFFQALTRHCSKEPNQLRIRAIALCTVLIRQLSEISKHTVVPPAIQTETKSFLCEITTRAVGIVLNELFDEITECICYLQHSRDGPVTLGDRYASIELLVIACHLLEEDSSFNGFWRAVQSAILPSPGQPRDARALEACWKKLFSVLPFVGFDRQGVLDAGCRQRHSMDNLMIVKQLLKPIFEVYESKTYSQSPAINNYCRALFGRCFQLIDIWGWRKCESMIGVLFDFFARRNLAHLPNEECNGSPAFLSQLDQKPHLDLDPGDRCFHILLKIIGSGLQRMQEIYTGKKIRDIVWRLMPNHGRLLPKDQAIQQTDLDALRNHHDLLCTLYWASPPGFRPKPTVIQDLVDMENSHREACRINIRAWSNLIAFQLTEIGPSMDLEPFVNWWNDLLRQVLRQHHNARIEAEEQARLAESTVGVTVDRTLLESTVAQNQRQVEAMLSDVLLAMRNAISIVPSIEAATTLLSSDLSLVFNLFSVRSPYTNKVIVHALEVLLVFTDKALPPDQTCASADNDDSQDYGDWSGFETVVSPNSSTPEAARYLEEHFQKCLRQLLSNCFGADSPPEDSLLTKVIDAWVAIGRVLVHDGRRAWSDYIGGYGPDSWASLRDTEQTHRFSAYYLAVMVETNGKVFEAHRQIVLKVWVASLVERELLLKYQHRLTSSLFNACAEDPMLANPPFWAVDGRFQITASQFSERRLALISNVLSNMRKAVERGQGKKASESAKVTAEYKEILMVMMNTMKTNYQQLGQGSDIRGAYVDFVHRVVELLQQHTSSICPISRFFTDSSSFPLPATDPTYVVGQLKNYGLRLHDRRTPKQLAVFIQSVSERAAIDRQQPYLVDQLYTAMTSTTQEGPIECPDLRSFLTTIIFPAYIDLAFRTACGWVLALPILEASKVVLSTIITAVNGVDKASVDGVAAMIMTILGSVGRSLEWVTSHGDLMDQPKTLRLLSAYFAAITASLPALDYLCRVSPILQHARSVMRFFRSFGLFAARTLLGHTDIETPDSYDTKEESVMSRHAEVRAFTLQELTETLTKHWVYHDETYYVNRGLTRRKVVVDLGLLEEEKAGFIKEIEGFSNALDRMTVLRIGVEAGL
ncbi:MAG: hypothetical protein L6R39_007372 [Caloplaca ligustica]|nr:MAG: hypothetical protein L6R39_007372 [Caloplaca ligustica]